MLNQENRTPLHQSPLHPEKVTVWSAICSTGIIGPYFFEDENDETVTVTGVRYRHMIQNFLNTRIRFFGLCRHVVSTGRCYIAYSQRNNEIAE